MDSLLFFSIVAWRRITLMAELLKTVQGKFTLSLNDRPETRELFKGFFLHDVSTLYSITRGNPQRLNELLISNVELSG